MRKRLGIKDEDMTWTRFGHEFGHDFLILNYLLLLFFYIFGHERHENKYKIAIEGSLILGPLKNTQRNIKGFKKVMSMSKAEFG
jgi:hypothetical protein